MSIYERIQEVAKEKNLTIRDIERYLGYANGSLRKWKNSANSARLIEVAEFLGVSTDYLLGKTSFKYLIEEPDDPIQWKIDRGRDFELRRGVFLSAFNSLVDFSLLTEIAENNVLAKDRKEIHKGILEVSDIDKEKIVGLFNGMFYYWLCEQKEHKGDFYDAINSAYTDYCKKRGKQIIAEYSKKNK